MTSAVKGLDVTATVAIVIAALSTVVTSALAQQMYDDTTKYKDFNGDGGTKYSKRAKRENRLLMLIYLFAVIFLILYVGYIGYKQGIHKAAGGGAPYVGMKSLKDYGISMFVLAYVTIALLILTGAMGIDMYKTGETFGVVTEDNPEGDKKQAAKNLYTVYIIMLVVASVAFVLLTAYLADARAHMTKFYESWLSEPSTASGAPSTASAPSTVSAASTPTFPIAPPAPLPTEMPM